MIFVDTSAFFALINPDDAMHQRSKTLWSDALEARRGLITTNYVELEASALLQNRLGLAAVRQFHRLLRPCSVRWIDEALHRAGVEILLGQNRRKLSLVDCTSIAAMRSLGIDRTFAFDRHFAQFGFGLLEPPSKPI